MSHPRATVSSYARICETHGRVDAVGRALSRYLKCVVVQLIMELAAAVYHCLFSTETAVTVYVAVAGCSINASAAQANSSF